MSIATIIIGAVVAIAAYTLGHYSGENRGKAIGWLERNQQAMDHVAKRAQRFDRLHPRDGGRFAEKEVGHG